MMEINSYRSVWDAIAESPEEAHNLKLRSQLMDAIEAYIERESITQNVAAERLGVPRSRVSELVNGRISKFTIDKLVKMAARVGLTTSIRVEEEAHVARSCSHHTNRILGVDFTSRPTRRKPITVADCTLRGDVLEVRTVMKLGSFDEFERLLDSDGPWVAAIDMPFAQPGTLIDALGWPRSWRDCVSHVEKLDKTAFESALNGYRNAQPAGHKEHRRRVDELANSIPPMRLHFQPVGKMFFQGAPRLLRSGANIVPCARNDASRTVVEAYPALAAEYLSGTRSYKHDRKPKSTHKDARRKIVTGLCGDACAERYGVRVLIDTADAEELVRDGKADLLDAVLCALQGAWSSRQPDFGVPPGCEEEGWIVDPALVEGDTVKPAVPQRPST